MESYGKYTKLVSKSKIHKYFSQLRLFASFGRPTLKFQYKLTELGSLNFRY